MKPLAASANYSLIIDFDSTLVQVEALDELAGITLAKHPEKASRVAKIKEITNAGMAGKLSISDSLSQRLKLLEANKIHLTALVKLLRKAISPSFKRNKAFLRKNASRIYVVTSGFVEYVAPVIEELGLKKSHLYGNQLEFGRSGEITGFNRSLLLAKAGGKIEQVRAMKLDGQLKGAIYVIGDGYTDYEIFAAGAADRFYAFTENVRRESVVSKAEHELKSFDEFLFAQKLPTKISYPKSKMKVLLLESVHPVAVERFKAEGFAVETVSEALDEPELIRRITDVSILGIRSKTRLTKAALEAAPKLLATGAFCIGTDQIDLNHAALLGVSAFNAPYSNTRSVVELAIGEIIMLMRRAFECSAGLHLGKWSKSASGCYEVRGKKIGIIGYGNIGSQLSVLAESLGLEVYFYDVVEKLALGNAKRCKTLAELLKISDIISLHVDGRGSNKNLLGAKELALVKPGALLLNLSRGHIVDIDAVVHALKSGRLGGAAIDVFPYEPKSNSEEFISPLRGLPNVILTSHIGGSTLEAQRNIAEFVSNRLLEYVNTGSSFGSVNFPNIQLPTLSKAHRLLHVHRNVPGILAEINQLLAKRKINILGQYLKTTDQIGYVITDIDKKYPADALEELRRVPNTIRFRVLY